MEQIKLNEGTSIYKSNIKVEFLDSLIKEINLNISVNPKTNNSEYSKSEVTSPGIQSNIIIDSKNISTLKSMCVDIIKKVGNYEISNPYYVRTWVFISNNKTEVSGWHSHNKPMPDDLVNISDFTWTFTYYLQMPDNLTGDEGYIFFKTKDGKITKIMPEVGDLFVFPADLEHRPDLNRNSTKDRIVYAGNFMDLNFNSEYTKKTKTLL
jgi:hypothetical protein